jgi:TetR/AcrR family acrAB operon transcriptional repressor
MTPPKLAQCVEMAINGAKSAHPGMQPADAFVADLTTMTRMLITGAVIPLPKSPSAKSAPKKAAPKKPVAKKPTRQNSGGRK